MIPWVLLAIAVLGSLIASDDEQDLSCMLVGNLKR